MKKRYRFVGIVFGALLLVGCAKQSAQGSEAKEKNHGTDSVTIGSQKAVTPYYLAKEKNWFEEEFKKLNVTVNWVEVQGGAPQFEAVAAKRIDFFVTGNTPPISAQVAKIPFKTIAVASTGQKNVGLVVKEGSSIKQFSELKGKKIAVAKATAAYDILLRLFNQNHVSEQDVEVINLPANEAKAAFLSGSVDAWVVTEPFLSQSVIDDQATVLGDGSSINYTSPAFYIGREEVVKQHPEYAQAFLRVLKKATDFQKENLKEAVTIYSEQLEMNPKVVEQVIEHVNFTLEPVSDSLQEGQQTVAQFLFDQGVIDAVPNTKEVTDNTPIEAVLKESNK